MYFKGGLLNRKQTTGNYNVYFCFQYSHHRGPFVCQLKWRSRCLQWTEKSLKNLYFLVVSCSVHACGMYGIALPTEFAIFVHDITIVCQKARGISQHNVIKICLVLSIPICLQSQDSPTLDVIDIVECENNSVTGGGFMYLGQCHSPAL